ncbi:MAG: 16S rRNA (cytosine(967)-C(5))-methyltransferase RsmB, partial [Clostridiales bacterium]|nr:16S rRNA (cytosine(967)-C(5))-methyltransferase RsmB [Clostridiales bacterium]
QARLPPDDARLAATLFYTALENRLWLDYLLNGLVKSRPAPAAWEILHLAAAQILFMDRVPDHAAVDEAVRQARALGMEGLTPLVNGTLRALIRQRDAGELKGPDRGENLARHLSVVHSMSEPIVKRLIDAFGPDEAERILAYRPAERWETIRPNLSRVGEREFEAYLTERGFSWREGPVPLSFQLQRAGDLSADPGYLAGMFTIQGAASMLAALATEAAPGMQVLDACAAPGGKAALMSERMQDTGRVYAYELHPHRAELIKALARRLGLFNIRPAVVDSTIYRPDNEERMDAVLIDAPCSGLGEVGNKPDIRFRLKDEDIDAVTRTQRRLLDTCCRYVRPGGLLVYSTCTILPEENARQVAAFLADHPEFLPDDGDDWLPERFRGRLKNGAIQFMPHIDEGMDGFFIARLRRAGAPR